MSNAELVSTSSTQQVRSYHNAFAGELTLYTLGGDLRPWRPIPARGIFWAGAIEITTIAATHVLNLSLPFGSFDWALLYLVLPFSSAWLFTVAKIEGRRLHVALTAWIRHAFLGYHLVGGCHRVSKAKPLGPSKINVAMRYEAPKTHPAVRYAVASLPLLVLLLTLWIALSSHTTKKAIASSAPAISFPLVKMPVLRIATTKLVPRHRHRPVQNVVRKRAVRLTPKSPVRRTVAPSTSPLHVFPKAPLVHHRYTPVFSPHALVVHSTPVAHSTATVPPVRRAPVTPAPSGPSCYPGALGC